MTVLLTEGDLVRGRPPDRTMPQWRCSIVDRATGAVCTLRPHPPEVQHSGWAAIQGAGRSKYQVSWTGGTERAMVVDGYTWVSVPGTDVEIRVLGKQPAALRYRPRR